jgi:hypothetical protein
MSPDDLIELCAEVGHDPALSYELAGSREHMEAVCRLAVDLAQQASAEGRLHATSISDLDAIDRTNRALIVERDRLITELDQARNAWQGDVLLRDAAEGKAEDAATCAMMWQAIADRALRDAKRVPAEQLVVDAGLDLSRELVRERARHAKTQAELAKALRRLEEQQRTRALNDEIRGAFARAVPAICDGVTVEDLNHRLDEELAAHPDPGPLHHARDQREQDGGL